MAAILGDIGPLICLMLPNVIKKIEVSKVLLTWKDKNWSKPMYVTFLCISDSPIQNKPQQQFWFILKRKNELQSLWCLEIAIVFIY